MAETPWSPAELDRLEDALEGIELDGALDGWLEDEPSSQVRERLVDYRSILAASREALPMADVPHGLLDSVIAEARQAAAVAPPAMVAREGWWVRVRRSFMVPAIALAGTAVLVLYIGQPDEKAAFEPPASSAPTPRTPSAVRLEFVDAEEAEPPPESPAPAASPDAAATAAPPGDAAAKAQGRKKKVGLGSGDDPLGGIAWPDDGADEAQQAEAKIEITGKDKDDKSKAGGETGPASGRWDIVSRGDRARQAGDCITAREEYALALEDDEARVRARAFAGMGLCERLVGNGPAADANFDRARELDGDIDGFIDSQNLRKSKPKRSSKKKKSKPKSNAKMMDPFG